MRHAGRWLRSVSGLEASGAEGAGAALRRRSAAELRWLWLGVSLWLLLSAGLLAGAPRPVAIVLGGLGLLLGVAFFRPLGANLNPFVLFFFVLSAWTLFTAIPLPCGVVRWAAPFAADIWADASSPLGAAGPRYCSLSLAPAATVQGAMNLASYALLAAGAGTLARRLGLWALCLPIFAVAVLVALITLTHALLGAEHLLGLSFLPARTGTTPVSVLINPNNLAGYMNLGVFSGLSLLASRNSPVPRSLLAVGGMICVATLLLSASRGGVLAFAFGILAWLALALVRRFSPSRSAQSELRSQAPFALVILVAGALVALLGSNPDIERELFAGDLSKVQQLGLQSSSLQRLDWTGIGRGAFDSLSAQLTNEGANFTYEYVECFALSWLIEWGLVVGGAALLALAWLLAPGRLGLRTQHAAEVAWLGLVVLFLQNLADLALELPAVMGAVAVLGSGLEGSRGRRQRAARTAPDLGGRRLLPALLALLLVTSACTIWTSPSLATERAQLRELALPALAETSAPPSATAAWRAIEAGLGRFPAEPYFVLVGGWLSLRHGGDAMPWATQALRRAPHSARAHALVAEVLARRGAVDQALLHVRRAAAADGTLTPAMASRVVRWTQDARRLEAAAPGGRVGARFLLELMGGLGADPRARRHLLTAAVQRAPADSRVQTAEGWALLGDLHRKEAPCPLDAAEASCPVPPDTRERILALSALTRDTTACDGLRLHAALLVEEGNGRGALDLLSSCPSCAAPGHCARDRVSTALDHGDEAERRLALGAFRSAMCDGPARCAEAEAFLASLFERRGKRELSLLHAWRAAEIEPSAPRYLAAARAARNAGRVERVEVALLRAGRLGGHDPELERWLEQRRRPVLEDLK